jgi:hypothetical protein
MKSLETLIEAGLEHGAVEHVAGLFRVYAAPTSSGKEADNNLRAGLEKLEDRLEHARQIADAHLKDIA